MKGLLVLFNGIEDSEALSTVALLRRARIQIETATQNINQEVKTAYGTMIKADHHLDHIDYTTYDFLVIAGGPYVSKIIETETKLPKIIKHFYKENKVIAAICAAPRFLGRLGILDGKTFTCFPGCEKDMPKGNYMPNRKAITDGKIITGRSAGAVVEFTYNIVEILKDKEAAEGLLNEIIYN